MKKISLIILTTLFYFNTNAQKIELKKDKILIDNKEVFSYKKSNRNTEFSIFKLNTNEELIFVVEFENETIGYRQDDYYKINFVGLKLKIESTNIQSSWKNLIKWFYENNLFDLDGNLNKEKIEYFIDKYNENITERTRR